ncbi:MAG: MerR family transcriptional regulator [Clostridia bacterium]|nr:MerR family transcriptional regulator [Clostridia bacterium]
MRNRDKLLSIGEVGKSLRVTRRMIINYEQHGLIKPDAKEGTLGNRYYTIDTVARIRTIRVLQNLGLSLSEIKEYFGGTKEMEALILRLEAQRDELNQNIRELRLRADIGDAMQFSRVTIPKQTVFCRKFVCSTIEEKKERLREAVTEALKTYGFDTGRRMFFIEFPLSDPTEVACYVSVLEGSVGENILKLPKTEALCVTWRGEYERLPEIRERMLDWAEKEGLEHMGVCRHIYLEGPPQHGDESKFITRVALPLRAGDS